MFTWQYGHKYKNMTSSKRVRTRHHIQKFLHKYLILKIHPNSGQALGITAEGRKGKMAN